MGLFKESEKTTEAVPPEEQESAGAAPAVDDELDAPPTNALAQTDKPEESALSAGEESAAKGVYPPDPGPQKLYPAHDHVVPLSVGETNVSALQLGDRGALVITESESHMAMAFIEGARVSRKAGSLLGRIIAFLLMAFACQSFAQGWESDPRNYDWRGEHRFSAAVEVNGPFAVAGVDMAEQASALSERAVWSFGFSAADLVVTTNATDATVIGTVPSGWIVYDAMLQVSTGWTSLTNDATELTIGLNAADDVYAGGSITNASWSTAGIHPVTVVLNTRSSAIVTTNAASLTVYQADTASTNGAARLYLWAVRE